MSRIKILKNALSNLEKLSKFRKDKYDEILNVIDDTLNKYNNSTYLLIKEYLKRTNNKITFQTENTITTTLKVKQVDFDGFVITVKTKHVDLIITISEVLDVIDANGLIEIKMKNGFFILY